MSCKCIIDGFMLRENLTQLKNGLLEGKSAGKFLDNTMDMMIMTEIDCGVNLDNLKNHMKEIKLLTDAGRNLQALNRLDGILNPDDKESIIRHLERC